MSFIKFLLENEAADQAGAEQRMYQIYDTKQKKFIGKPSANRRRLKTRADKLDNEYGAYRYYVQPLNLADHQRVEEGALTAGSNPLRNQHDMRKRVTFVVNKAKQAGVSAPQEIVNWAKKHYPTATHEFISSLKLFLGIN